MKSFDPAIALSRGRSCCPGVVHLVGTSISALRAEVFVMSSESVLAQLQVGLLQ